VLLNTAQTEALINEGLAREMVNRIQKMRKDAELQHHNRAVAYCTFDAINGRLAGVAAEYVDHIRSVTGTAIRFELPGEGVKAVGQVAEDIVLDKKAEPKISEKMMVSLRFMSI
jgi:isoleucyl-tRNA synthetase